MPTTLTKVRAASIVTVAALGLLLGACGSDNPLDAAANAGLKSAPATTQAAPELLELSTSSNDALGEIVVDSEGRTLYRFDQDTKNPPASNCAEECADKWPPVLAGEKVSVDGIDGELIGTVDRPDGSQQVTLNGWPLYRFADDEKPGDINGQGVNGTWFVSTPDGAKAPAAAKNQQDQQQDNGQDQQQDDQQQDQQDQQNDQQNDQQDDDSGYGY